MAALFDTTVGVLLLRGDGRQDARELIWAARSEIAAGTALVSAVTGEGVEALTERLGKLVDDAPPIHIVTPPGEGAALAWLYRHGRVVGREEDEAGATMVDVRLTPQALGRFERLFPQAHLREAAE